MQNTTPQPLRLAIGGDHAGFPLKSELANWLGQQVTAVVDCGANDAVSSDYPDFAVAVGQAIREGRADRGLLICGSGVGVSVAANKIVGIRASLCHDTYSARQGVEHDDLNVLCIGARVIGPELAMDVIRSFLAARYTPLDRHARRVEKILAIEKQNLNPSGT
ncbi:ribose 5-phosphate isomerase B [Planctomycetaceae bacterium SH139]